MYATKISTNKNSIIYFQGIFFCQEDTRCWFIINIYIYTSQNVLKILALVIKSKIFDLYLRVMSSFLQNKDSECCCHYSGKRYVCLLRWITIICQTSAHVLFTTKSGSMVTFIIVIWNVPATCPNDPIFIWWHCNKKTIDKLSIK